MAILDTHTLKELMDEVDRELSYRLTQTIDGIITHDFDVSLAPYSWDLVGPVQIDLFGEELYGVYTAVWTKQKMEKK